MEKKGKRKKKNERETGWWFSRKNEPKTESAEDLFSCRIVLQKRNEPCDSNDKTTRYFCLGAVVQHG